LCCEGFGFGVEVGRLGLLLDLGWGGMRCWVIWLWYVFFLLFLR
jgi:hypothetical protein